MNWNYWATLNWVHDTGGTRVLAGELLLIAGGLAMLFAYLVRTVRPYPTLGLALGSVGVIVGAFLLGSGLWAHRQAGLAWWDWDWDGEGRST